MRLRHLIERIAGRRNDWPAPPSGATHVLQFISPRLLDPPGPGGCGWWEIQELANYLEGMPADDAPGIHAFPVLTAAALAAFAERELGCRLILTPFEEEVMVAADWPDGEWLPADGFYLTPR